MQYVELANGQKIPALGLGTWKLNDGVAREAVYAALEIGYRHIDCAWIYENESDVGAALTAGINEGLCQRDDLFVTSKLWNDRHRAADVAPALKGTLADLQLDHLDLYLIHWPVAQQSGVPRPETAADFLTLDQAPLAETWQAMQQCVDAGLCRNIGISNFSAQKITSLIEETGITPACNQVESHPYLQQNELFEFCTAHRIAFTAYSPLGSGDRPDGMKQENEPALFADPVLQKIADSYSVTVAQVMLAWAVTRGSIAIPKSANRQRMADNFAAAALQLSDDDMTAIAALDRHHRYVDGTFWELPDGPYTVANLWDEEKPAVDHVDSGS